MTGSTGFILHAERTLQPFVDLTYQTATVCLRSEIKISNDNNRRELLQSNRTPSCHIDIFYSLDQNRAAEQRPRLKECMCVCVCVATLIMLMQHSGSVRAVLVSGQGQRVNGEPYGALCQSYVIQSAAEELC